MKTGLKISKIRDIVVLLIAVVGFVGVASAAPMYNIPMMLTQPDGTQVSCFASGDEFHNWLHDENGFTIMQHPETGFYVYALQDGDFVKASNLVVGTVDPSSERLTPNVNLSEWVVDKKRSDFESKMANSDVQRFSAAKGTGNLSNIVIYIKFSGETLANEDFTYYSDLYHKAEGPSLLHYYRHVSQNTLDVNSTFLPAPSGGLVVWHTDTNPRGYYRPYNATTNTQGYDPNASSGATSRTYREHTMLNNAVNALKASIPADFNVDANGDGYVDCISFIVSGAPDGWSDLLWPHRWALYSYSNFINGKRVYDYTFQLQFTSTAQTSRMNLGTVAHEMFHIIGAPDLYRYTNTTITPVGVWDLMASTGTAPQHMTNYMKYIYGGWIQSIPDIAQSGTYTLNSIEAETQNFYRIPSGKSHTEYYVIEYRRKQGMYENTLPASGLIVYRINERNVGVGNAQGPPDELYIYRPVGSPTMNGAISLANFSSPSRTIFNKDGDPYPFLSDGTIDDVHIYDIGTATGATMNFKVLIDYEFQRAMNYYKSLTNNGLNLSYGAGNAPVAIKLTPSELASFVDNYITKVEFVLRSGGGTSVSVKIWEGTENNAPKDLIYTQDVSSEVIFDNFTLHTLTSPIKIKPGTDYWVGYELVSTGYGTPFGRDKGPIIAGKGGWVKYNGEWKQLNQISSSYNYNLLISAIIQNISGTDVETNGLSAYNIKATSYPNPFGDATTIKYTLQNRSLVSLKVFNMLGQEVTTLVAEVKEEGDHTVDFNATQLPSGVYMYRIELNQNPETAVSGRMIKY
jgi:M6 family metalloprotease-like protein